VILIERDVNLGKCDGCLGECDVFLGKCDDCLGESDMGLFGGIRTFLRILWILKG